jgi:cytochrome c oxidase assembly protein subunit 15
MAVVLAVAIVILFLRVRRDPASTPLILGVATALVALLAVQILLGASVIWSLRRPDLTTAHVIVGAATLAAASALACLAHRDTIESRSSRP